MKIGVRSLPFGEEAERHRKHDAATGGERQQISAGRSGGRHIGRIDSIDDHGNGGARRSDADGVLRVEQVIEAESDLGLIKAGAIADGVVEEEID